MFLSEPIQPAEGTTETRTMASGVPGLPKAFTWRNGTLRVARVVRTWRETGPCKHGSLESYARKHWFEVETDSHQVAKLYFERQPRGQNRKQRWWLFSLSDG